MDNIVPNFNPNLVVLYVLCGDDPVATGSTTEYPIIAWRISEDAYPVPIAVDRGETPEIDEGSGWMVFDRASKLGSYEGVNIYTREKCIETIIGDLALRQHNAQARKKKAGAK